MRQQKEFYSDYIHMRLKSQVPSYRAFNKKFKDLCDKTMKVLEKEYFQKTLKLKLKDKKKMRLSWDMTLCGKQKITTLNTKYRGKNKITDVLSFPVHEWGAREASLQKLLSTYTHVHLGDIFICLEQAKKQATHFSISLEHEIIHLLVHGIFHLLGFDHERSAKDEKIMQKWEKKCLDKILQG